MQQLKEGFETGREALRSFGFTRIVSFTTPEVVGDGEALLALAAGARGADLLVTTGGVSVGEYDVVKTVLSRLGEINFWRVAMKPGKPQAYGIADGKPIFGLPGNPVSSLVVFELFVRPALLKMAGHTDLLRPTFKAVLEEDVANKDGRVSFMRAIIEQRDGKYYARTTGPQGSGILYSLVLANGFIVIPSGATLKAGDEIEAQFLG
ncbi:MAG: molybdopterin molybdotransferase MoeA [Chloroflexi bacterium]|nr:molybdopterin molybdotransferase MoeA [Chloroflexota bacterium]